MSDLTLEVDGVVYTGFKTARYSRSIENLSGQFSFVATAEGMMHAPFRANAQARILMGDVALITGYVETMDISYSDSNHEIRVSGRDKTADIVDSSLRGNVDFKAPISLETIIRNVLELLEIEDIEVRNLVDDLEDFAQGEIAVGKVGENAFQFLEKHARKRGVLITSNGEGDIIIARAGIARLRGALIHQVQGRNNNVKTASVSLDFTERFNKYVVKSQGNPALAGILGAVGQDGSDFESAQGEATDSDIRASRYLEINAEGLSNGETATQRAMWEANVRRARSQVYSCELTSLFADENRTYIFVPNTLIQVQDDFANIRAIMLIRSVNYEIDADSGTTVNLELVQKDSYTLQAERDRLDSESNEVTLDLFAQQSE